MVAEIKQMGEDTGAGEVNKIDTGWPPKRINQTMQKQMGEDRGDIAALLDGGRYEYDRSASTGEGVIVGNEEEGAYLKDKKPRVPGGTEGFKGVPNVFEPVKPYPEVDKDLYGREPLGAGYQPKNIVPVTETPGNSKVVGDMVTGMPKDGEFSGPARVGPGDMVADYERGEQTNPKAEDGFVADLIGDIVTGHPWDGYPREEHLPSEIAPEGLVTGGVKGEYAPGLDDEETGQAGKDTGDK